MTELSIPELSLVVLVGVTGSGKSTFAAAHFKPTEVISSDFCRGLVADDENDQSATPAAFEVLRFIVGQRLKAGRLTVVDATNVQPEARRGLVLLAREYDVLPVAIVLDLPERLCAERNAQRPDRDFGPHVIRRQRQQLRRYLKSLPREGFRTVHALHAPDEIQAATITRVALFNDLRHESGPFDVIGDVHGCRAELEQLLDKLGYAIARDGAGRPVNASHPTRRAVFLGDLVDRGPDTPGVLRLVMGMVAAGTAFCVPGNHEAKLLRALRGKNVKRSHGLDASMEQLEAETEEFRVRADRFIDGLISHYVLDGGRLVVAHAGLIERYHGRASGRVREFCLYGQTTGETDEYGLPVRYPWAQEYRGQALVLYGHTPVPETEWVNNTLCLDTGCVFGGRLTALNYPERTLVSVPAARVYHPPARPFPVSSPSGAVSAGPQGPGGPARREPDVLDIGDVSGSRVIETGYLPRVGVREAHAAAALEVMSRFALDPRWLLYLPPTMSPVATSTREGLLEHPEQAFTAYQSDGVTDVLCEEKHMGSRAVLLICRTPAAARVRFSVPPAAPVTPASRAAQASPAAAAAQASPAAAAAQASPAAAAAGDRAAAAAAQASPAAAAAQASPAAAAAGDRADAAAAQASPAAAAAQASSAAAAAGDRADACGAIWTRTGRPFFPAALTADLVDRVRSAAEQAGLFSELDTLWLLFDAELLPWNVKAGQLLRDQYAAVGAAARASLPAAISVLEQAAGRPLPADGPAVHALLDRTRARMTNADAFTAAYLRYCWSTDGLSGVRVAPFQLLASEGAVYHERPHQWHLEIADRLAAAAPDLIATTRRLAVDVGDPASVATATQWWEDLTAGGGEGMVVKPAANLARARRGSDSSQHGRGSDSSQHGRGSDSSQHGRGSDSSQHGRGSDSSQHGRGSDSSQHGRGSDSSQHGRGSDSDQQSKGLVQPGLKVRGREYLRLIYGPDYTEPGHLDRLRQRALSHKRSLALREYALGLEALDRVARGEPLWRVHECVFAVLALESEPVDPRL